MRLIHTTCYPMNCHCCRRRLCAAAARAALAPSVHCSCCKSSRSFTKAAASFSFPPPPTRSYFGPSSFPKRETTILAQLCGHRDSYLAPFPMPPIFIGRSFSFAASEDLRYWGHSWIRILTGSLKNRDFVSISKPLLAKQRLKANVSQENQVLCHVLRQFSIVLL